MLNDYSSNRGGSKTFCGTDKNCVTATVDGNFVLLGDTKTAAEPLQLSANEWEAFVDAINERLLDFDKLKAEAEQTNSHAAAPEQYVDLVGSSIEGGDSLRDVGVSCSVLKVGVTKDDFVVVGDARNYESSNLLFTRLEWDTFIDAAKRGEADFNTLTGHARESETASTPPICSTPGLALV